MSAPLLCGGLVLVCACLVAPHAAAEPGTAQGSVAAVIVEPIALTALHDLDFGGIAVSGTSGGSVTVAADGSAQHLGVAAAVCGSARCMPRALPASDLRRSRC